MKGHFENFAAYNSWANDTLYAAVGDLSADQRNQDLSGFFKSIMGTLNHILVGDLLWMQRLGVDGPVPKVLDEILHSDFDTLYCERKLADGRLIHLMHQQTDDSLRTYLDYKTTKGDECHDQISAILSHMLNHQTHHRGQCHHMLSQLGEAPPSIDMIYFIRSIT